MTDFDNPIKRKNDAPKPKNDAAYKPKNADISDFDELLYGDDELDDRYPRSRQPIAAESLGCSAYIGSSLEYPTSGPGVFGKLLVGGILTFIPLIGQLIMLGYTIRIIRRVLRDQTGLPDWNDFGGDLVRGVVVWVGSIVFGVLLALSMIAVVTIPVVMIFGLPMVAYVMCRYAATDDFLAFTDIFGAYKYVFQHLWPAIVVTLSAVLLSLVWMIAVGLGFAFFFFPGILALAATTFSFAYLMGAWGRTVGLEA